jgi:hypothetical protein
VAPTGRSDRECGSGKLGPPSSSKRRWLIASLAEFQGGRAASFPVLAEGLRGDMRLIRIDRGEFYSGGGHPQIKVPHAFIAAAVFYDYRRFDKPSR